MIRSRTAQLASCLIPGLQSKTSSSSTAADYTSSSSSNAAARTLERQQNHEDHEDLVEVKGQQDPKKQQEHPQRQEYYYSPQKQHHHPYHSTALEHSSEPGLLASSSDSSSTTTWADVTCALEGLEFGSFGHTHTHTTPPHSPIKHPDHVRHYYNTNSIAVSPIPIPGTPTRSRSTGSLSSMASSTTRSSSRRSRNRVPLTSPSLPRSSPSRRSRSSHNTPNSNRRSSPHHNALPLPPSQKVMETVALLKSIKLQIKALKRRESRLGCELHVQRRERQQMREQIAYLEARRLRVEALFLRPLPLILLWPTSTGSSSYDVCLVSEGNDAWTSLEQPLLSIDKLDLPLSCPDRPILVHFGPTTTHPMAAAFTIVPPPTSSANTTNPNDIQPVVKHADLPFWERVLSMDVLDGDACWELDSIACQFLFESLMEQKDWWRHSMTPVVDKKTRRVQWVLAQQAQQQQVFYETIPMH